MEVTAVVCVFIVCLFGDEAVMPSIMLVMKVVTTTMLIALCFVLYKFCDGAVMPSIMHVIKAVTAITPVVEEKGLECILGRGDHLLMKAVINHQACDKKLVFVKRPSRVWSQP